jgi:anti-sigma factor RsiW
MEHVRKEQISAFVDRQLDVRESRALEAHFRECADCRTICDEMRDLTFLFREAERFEPSPFLWNRIALRLNEEAPSARSWTKTFIPGQFDFGWKSGLAAAVLMVLIITGILTFHGNGNRAVNQAAFAEIDQTYEYLAAQNFDTYNPFSSGSSYGIDADQNPFREMRLNVGIGNALQKH